MSRNGHCATGTGTTVATFPMSAGTRYDWHTHVDHQLAWAASGVLVVRTEDATWVLPHSRAVDPRWPAARDRLGGPGDHAIPLHQS